MSESLNQDVLGLASLFQHAFGIDCMAADASSRFILNDAPFCGNCGFARCDYVNTHLTLSADAPQNGRVYSCPAGLAFLIAPFHSGARRLALIAGPFIAESSTASAFAHLNANLQKRIERLHRLSPERAFALGEILALSANGLSIHPAAHGAVQTGHADVLRKIEEYVYLNYRHKFTLDDIARHVFLSRSYLSGVFKAETGKTLSSYINDVRIEKSKALLCETPLSLLDIALLCGFEDQSYFSKVFKAIEGVAPKDYRAQALRFGWPES